MIDVTESQPVSGKSKLVDDGGSNASGGTTSTWSDFKEVDSDLNPTELYQKVCNEDWEGALTAIEQNPLESRMWVVHGDPYRDSADEEDEDDDFYEHESVRRFLPLHASCMRRPPLAVVAALLTSYPEGSSLVDMNGMFALHYACANQASVAVIELLLVRNQEVNRMPANIHDGALPIHLAAQFGVSSPDVIRALLLGNNDLVCATDNAGCTPLDIAMFSKDYSGRYEVIGIMRKALKKEKGVHKMSNGDDLIIPCDSSKFQQVKGRRGQNARKSDEICDITSIISNNFSAIQQLKRGGHDPLVDNEKSLDKPPHSRKTDHTEQLIAEIGAIRQKITELEAAKLLHVKGTRDQIEQTWKTVNMAVEEIMECQRRQDRTRQSRKSENRPWRSAKSPESRTPERLIMKVGSSHLFRTNQDPVCDSRDDDGEDKAPRIGEKKCQSRDDSSKHSRSTKKTVTWQDLELRTVDEEPKSTRSSKIGSSFSLPTRRHKSTYGSENDSERECVSENARKKKSLSIRFVFSSRGERERTASKSPRQLEDMRRDNIRMEAEVRRLEAKRVEYEQEAKAMRKIISGMSKAVPQTDKKIEGAQRKFSKTTSQRSSRREMVKKWQILEAKNLDLEV